MKGTLDMLLLAATLLVGASADVTVSTSSLIAEKQILDGPLDGGDLLDGVNISANCHGDDCYTGE